MRTLATDVFVSLSATDQKKIVSYLEKVVAHDNALHHKDSDRDYHEEEHNSGINHALRVLQRVMNSKNENKWEVIKKLPHSYYLSKLLTYAFRHLRSIRKKVERCMWKSMPQKIRYIQYGNP